MLRVVLPEAIDDARIVRCRLLGHFPDLAGGNGRGLLRGNGRPSATESPQQICERAGKRAARSKRPNEFVEQPGALLWIGVAKKMNHHFAERRCLVRAESSPPAVG